jgi:hypothetical protein
MAHLSRRCCCHSCHRLTFSGMHNPRGSFICMSNQAITGMTYSSSFFLEHLREANIHRSQLYSHSNRTLERVLRPEDTPQTLVYTKLYTLSLCHKNIKVVRFGSEREPQSPCKAGNVRLLYEDTIPLQPV